MPVVCVLAAQQQDASTVVTDDSSADEPMEDELNDNLTGRDWCVKIHPDSGQASALRVQLAIRSAR